MDRELLWANPTLARRDGGWAWLAWDGEAGTASWVPASAALDAAIAATRTGGHPDDVRATHGGDFVDALVRAGILVLAALPVSDTDPDVGEVGRDPVSTDRDAVAGYDRRTSAGLGVGPAPGPRTSAEVAARELAGAHAAFVGAFAREHGDVEVPLLEVLEVPIGPGPLLARVRIGPPDEAAPPPTPANALLADVVLPGATPPVGASCVISLHPLATPTLALDDLRVSIVGDRLALRSVALDRAIVPRLPRRPHDGDPGLVHLLAALGGGAAPARFPDRAIEVAFPFGGEWLEVKLYASPRLVDAVLAELVAPFVERASLMNWHYVRAADPRWHVRLRLRGEPRELVRDVLPALRDAADPWLADGRLRDFQIGTYRREVERYGGAAGTLLAERVFTADSACAAALCGLLTPDEDGDDARWRIVLLGAAQLVDDLVPGERGAVFAAMRDDLRRRVGRADVAGVTASFDDLGDARRILDARSARLAPVAVALRKARLTRPLGDIAASLAHAFANRMFRAFALEQELVVYELLTAS